MVFPGRFLFKKLQIGRILMRKVKLKIKILQQNFSRFCTQLRMDFLCLTGSTKNFNNFHQYFSKTVLKDLLQTCNLN